MIVGIIRRKPVLTYASIIFGGMLASVNSVNSSRLRNGQGTKGTGSELARERKGSVPQIHMNRRRTINTYQSNVNDKNALTFMKHYYEIQYKKNSSNVYKQNLCL